MGELLGALEQPDGGVADAAGGGVLERGQPAQGARVEVGEGLLDRMGECLRFFERGFWLGIVFVHAVVYRGFAAK